MQSTVQLWSCDAISHSVQKTFKLYYYFKKIGLKLKQKPRVTCTKGRYQIVNIVNKVTGRFGHLMCCRTEKPSKSTRHEILVIFVCYLHNTDMRYHIVIITQNFQANMAQPAYN